MIVAGMRPRWTRRDRPPDQAARGACVLPGHDRVRCRVDRSECPRGGHRRDDGGHREHSGGHRGTLHPLRMAGPADLAAAGGPPAIAIEVSDHRGRGARAQLGARHHSRHRRARPRRDTQRNHGLPDRNRRCRCGLHHLRRLVGCRGDAPGCARPRRRPARRSAFLAARRHPSGLGPSTASRSPLTRRRPRARHCGVRLRLVPVPSPGPHPSLRGLPPMTDKPAASPVPAVPAVPAADPAEPRAAHTVDGRPYSPGLEGVLAAETELGLVDGANGRLMYRGYRIGDLVAHGTYASVANLLWTGAWDPKARMSTGRIPSAVISALRALPRTAKPMDALRTAVSVWGATQVLDWPPTQIQARALTEFSPSALAAFARIRQDLEPIDPDPRLDLVSGFLYQLTGERPDKATARALDAYFIVGAEHGLNASTFTARVITSTRSDMASAVAGAIGAMKGPLHGGAPSEVVEQIHKVGSPERAEEWVRDALARGERLMGFGHRVYRAYDPRAAALRKVVEAMPTKPDWLELAIKVEDVALRVLEEKYPDRPLKTNVEFYAAAVLQGVGLTPDLFPATFALARPAGWTAHVLEQASANRLIRPDARFIGIEERNLPK